MKTRFQELIVRKQKINTLISALQKEDQNFNAGQKKKRDKSNLKLVEELIGGKKIDAKKLSEPVNKAESDLSRLKPLLLVELDKADAEIRIINRWRNSKKAELYARNFNKLGDPSELADQAVKLLARLALIHRSLYSLKPHQVNDLGFLLNRYSDKAYHPEEIMKVAQSLNDGIDDEIMELEIEGTQVPTEELKVIKPVKPVIIEEDFPEIPKKLDPSYFDDDIVEEIKATEGFMVDDEPMSRAGSPKVKADEENFVSDNYQDDDTHDLTSNEDEGGF